MEEEERRRLVPSRITEGLTVDAEELHPLGSGCCCRRWAGARRAWEAEGFVERSRGIKSSLGGCVVGRGGGMSGTEARREAAAEVAAALLIRAASSARLPNSVTLSVPRSAA